jgi:enhancer of polycomb-like protein
MEALFSHNIPPNFFPTYTCPTGVPAPGVLSRMAKAIYPHWKDRRVFSEGKSIIPQLNVRLVLIPLKI